MHDGGCTEFVVQTETHAKVSRSFATNSINVITMITCAFKSETYFEKKYTQIKTIVTCKVDLCSRDRPSVQCSHKLVELVVTLWAKENDTIKILLNHHNEESPRVRPYTYKIFYHIFSIPSPLKISSICHQLHYNNSNKYLIFFFQLYCNHKISKCMLGAFWNFLA